MLDSGLATHERNPVAQCFSQAAHSYDCAAALQRDIGQQLLAHCPTHHAVHSWLDLGCGTGYFSQQLAQRYPHARAHGLDIAQGMLQHAHHWRPYANYVCGDAQALPVARASQDLVFSNMALQWCPNFAAVLAQVRAVLKPQGLFVFTSVLDGSLSELRQSWQAVDDEPHVNHFRCFTDYQALCQRSGLQLEQLHERRFVQYFPSVRELSYNLKQLGAHHIHTGRTQGLTSRQQYSRLKHAYEHYRQPQGLPATWQILLAVLRAS